MNYEGLINSLCPSEKTNSSYVLRKNYILMFQIMKQELKILVISSLTLLSSQLPAYILTSTLFLNVYIIIVSVMPQNKYCLKHIDTQPPKQNMYQIKTSTNQDITNENIFTVHQK